jgi:hypothetical protein
MNNVRRENSRHFKNKKKAHLRDNTEEIENNSKIKNVRDMYRGTNDFKKGYQPRTNMVMDENDEWFVDSYSILASRRNYFSQLLNVLGLIDVRQTDVHTAELLVPDTSAFGFEMAIQNLKSHKSPRIYQIPAELIRAWRRLVRSEIHYYLQLE